MALTLSPIIGCSDVVYALKTGNATWGTVYSLPANTKVGINPNGALATIFADNGPFKSAETIGEIDVALSFADVLPEHEARLLGHTLALGQLTKKSTDQSPEVAIGFKILHAGSTAIYSYVWLYKGIFTKPSMEIETKGASINMQQWNLVGKFSQLESTYEWMMKMRTDDPSAVSGTLTAFFSSVTLPSADNTALTVTVAEGTVGDAKKLVATFAKGSGSSFSMSSTTFLTDNVAVLVAAGIAAGTWSIGSAGTTVVCKFTFTTPPSSADVVGISVNSGVKDTNNVSCTTYGKLITIA